MVNGRRVFSLLLLWFGLGRPALSTSFGRRVGVEALAGMKFDLIYYWRGRGNRREAMWSTLPVEPIATAPTKHSPL